MSEIQAARTLYILTSYSDALAVFSHEGLFDDKEFCDKHMNERQSRNPGLRFTIDTVQIPIQEMATEFCIISRNGTIKGVASIDHPVSNGYQSKIMTVNQPVY